MTREALNKLNEKQMEYCETLSALIERAKVNGLKSEFKQTSGKLRGYLECLWQMGIIKEIEMRALYLWFMQADRSNHNS